MNIIVKLSLDLACWEYTLHFYEGLLKKEEATFEVPPQWERNQLRNGECAMFVESEGNLIRLPTDIFQLMEDEISLDPLVIKTREQLSKGEML